MIGNAADLRSKVALIAADRKVGFGVGERFTEAAGVLVNDVLTAKAVMRDAATDSGHNYSFDLRAGCAQHQRVRPAAVRFASYALVFGFHAAHRQQPDLT